MSATEGITLGREDEFLIVEAFRYARGRGPDTLHLTCSRIVRLWDELSEVTRSVIARDVALEIELRREEPAEVSARDRVEAPYWERLLDLAEDEHVE